MTSQLRRDATGGVLSLGRQMLLDALNRQPQKTIARAVRCSQSQISRLAAGTPTDSYRLRRALERYLAIPASSWDEPPIAHETAEASADDRAA